jgi:hypothetical protein
MKLLLLSFVGIMTAGTLAAQHCTVEIGPEFKTSGDLYLWNHLYSDAGGHYVLLAEENRGYFLYKKFTPILQKYDRAFKLVQSKEIPLEDNDISFDDMLYVGQKFVLCTSHDNKKTQKVTISATLVGLDGVVRQKRQITSLSYDNKDNFPDRIKWEISTDTSKILHATWADNDEAKLQTRLFVSVQDNNLAEIWQQNYTLPYNQNELEILNMLVSNTGQVFVTAKNYLDKKAAKKKDGPEPLAYKLVVFSMDGTSDKVKELSPEIPGKFITDLSINTGKSGELYCGGIYTNDKQGVIQGLFCQKTNTQTGTTELLFRKELSDSDIKLFNIQKDKQGNEGLDPNFEMKNLILKEDGSMVILAEEVFTSHESYTSGGSMKTVTIYNTNDVMVAAVSPAGTIEWIKMVPKNQMFGETAKYSSYALMVSGSTLCFIYNDDKDNISKPVNTKAKPISSFNDAVAAMLTINSTGKAERQTLFSIKKDTETLLSPKRCAQISSNELFFVTSGAFKLTGKNIYHMGVVRID